MDKSKNKLAMRKMSINYKFLFYHLYEHTCGWPVIACIVSKCYCGLFRDVRVCCGRVLQYIVHTLYFVPIIC